MPAFAKPRFEYDYDLETELEALRAYPSQKPDREIPEKADDRLLVATWNVANLGLQQRREKDNRVIAEIISWFDLVALQEVNDTLVGLRGVQAELPDHYRVLFSDAAGNAERIAFLYDTRKLTLREKVGELAVPPSDLQDIRLPDIDVQFTGFDRNPFLAAFEAGGFVFVLLNVHLYFGDEDSATGMARRCLEAYAVARWADLRRRSRNAFTPNIVALGDFNLPKREPGDPVFDALTRRGLRIPPHSTHVGGSNLNDDAHYDQVAVFPGPVEDAITRLGIFDFDGALFADLWADPRRTEEQFRAYMRYYISDHRPLWAEFRP